MSIASETARRLKAALANEKKDAETAFAEREARIAATTALLAYEDGAA